MTSKTVHMGNSTLIVTENDGEIVLSSGETGPAGMVLLRLDTKTQSMTLYSSKDGSAMVKVDSDRIFLGVNGDRGITIDKTGVTIHGGMVVK